MVLKFLFCRLLFSLLCVSFSSPILADEEHEASKFSTTFVRQSVVFSACEEHDGRTNACKKTWLMILVKE